MCAGLCLSRHLLYLSVSVFYSHFHSPPCFSKNGNHKQYFLCISFQGRGRGKGKQRDTQLHALNVTEGKVSHKVMNICYETTLIFNEHTRSYFNGWNSKQKGGVSHFLGSLWQTWLEYDTRFGKKDASTSRAIDAAAAMATGPWIKAMWIIMGWLTHNARPVSLRKLSLD